MEKTPVKARTIVRTIKDPAAMGVFVAPRNEAEYDAAVARLDALVDEVAIIRMILVTNSSKP
jgi:hypothetical protein